MIEDRMDGELPCPLKCMGATSSHSGIKSPFSRLSLVVALCGIRRRVLQITAIGKDDLIHSARSAETVSEQTLQVYPGYI